MTIYLWNGTYWNINWNYTNCYFIKSESSFQMSSANQIWSFFTNQRAKIDLKTGLILLRIWSSDPSVSSDKKSIFETYSGIKSTNGEHRRVFTIGFYAVFIDPITCCQNMVSTNQNSEWKFPYIDLRQRSVFHTFLLKLHFCWYGVSMWC